MTIFQAKTIMKPTYVSWLSPPPTTPVFNVGFVGRKDVDDLVGWRFVVGVNFTLVARFGVNFFLLLMLYIVLVLLGGFRCCCWRWTVEIIGTISTWVSNKQSTMIGWPNNDWNAVLFVNRRLNCSSDWSGLYCCCWRRDWFFLSLYYDRYMKGNTRRWNGNDEMKIGGKQREKKEKGTK